MQGATEIVIDTASAMALGARDRQEDALATAFPQGTGIGFSVLSDGMGGHNAGDVASRIIVSEVFTELTRSIDHADFWRKRIPVSLKEAVVAANACIQAHVGNHPECRGMGGTVIVTIVLDGMLYWISVGDSPLYLFRDGRLTRLNADHSLAPQIDLMVRRGMMDVETARNHPQRSCLTSAMIGEAIPEIDCPDAPFELMNGDLVIAASDGLQILDDDQIAEILRRRHRAPCTQVANALMSGVAAAADPEQDNISVVVMKAVAEHQASWVSPKGDDDPHNVSWKEAVSPLLNISARS